MEFLGVFFEEFAEELRCLHVEWVVEELDRFYLQFGRSRSDEGVEEEKFLYLQHLHCVMVLPRNDHT